MNRLEHKLIGSSLNFWKLLLTFVINLGIGMILSDLILPEMHFVRLLFAGTTMLILQLFTFYLLQFRLKIIVENSRFKVIKNSKTIIDSEISCLECYRTGDIYGKQVAADLKLKFSDGREFYFSLMAVYLDRKRREDAMNDLAAFLVKFNKAYDFTQAKHLTALGPSRNFFLYNNPNSVA